MTHLAIAMLLGSALQAAPARPQQQQPARRTTGDIEGTVFRAETNEPLGGAKINVLRVVAQGQSSGAPIAPVVTDSDGKFVIKDLAPGSYRLQATRNGYARQEYGQRSPRLPGTAVTVQAGQNAKDIGFRLTPAGTISGRITSSTGEPGSGITVQLLRSAYGVNGKRTLLNVVNTRTNDLGEYRLYWITPGTYFLSAFSTESYVQSFVQSQLSGAAAVSRGQNSSVSANATVAMMEAFVGMNANEVVQPDIAVTYYPGLTDRSKAAPISVQPGSEQRLPDMALVQERTFHIRGRVIDARTRQQPLTALVQIASKETLGAASPTNGNYDAATGAYEFRDVAAGEYIVVAAVPSGFGPTAIAQETVSVSNNVENLVLTVRLGMPVGGRVTLEGAKLFTALELSRMKVGLIGASDAVLNVSPAVSIRPDGSFTFENVTPGEYRVNIASLPPNVYIKQARFGETNLLEENASIETSTTGSFDIILNRNGGQINGTLVDKDSKPVAASQVVLAPDRQRDRRELFRSQTTDRNGKFTFQGISPGDYKIFAWDEIDPLAFMDPEILRQYESQAKAVKIAEMSQETVEVKIIPAAQ